MKVLKECIDNKRKSGSFELLPESPDDIYEVSKIIVAGDKLRCFTHRKLSLDGKTQQKIALFLSIKVESFSADLENGILYAKGKVDEENEHVKLGAYHTLEIELDKKFTFYKDAWNKTDINTIKQSTKSAQNILFIIFYDKDAVVSLVGKSRIKIVNKIKIQNKKFENFLSTVNFYIDKVEFIVICSSYNAVSDFKKFIFSNTELKKKASSESKFNLVEKIFDVKLPSDMKNATNKQVVNFVFTDSSVSKRFNSCKYVNDLKEISHYFLQFDKGNYDLLIGKSEIQESVNYGALGKIFFTDEVYRPHCIEKRRKIENFCKVLESSKIQIFVIPVSHLLGERLRDIGGVCGIAKFVYK